MTIIYLGIAWLGGIGLAAAFGWPAGAWLAAGGLAIVLAVLLRNRPKARLALAILTAIALGAARHEAAVPVIDEDHIASYNGQDVTLIGLVSAEPERSERATNFRLSAERLELANGQIAAIEGLVYVNASRSEVVAYGTRLRLQGSLNDLAEIPTPGFRAYLSRKGFFSQMRWPEVEILEREQGNPIRHGILALKDRGRESIGRSLPDPQGALLTGILLGDDSGLPKDLVEQFRITGLTHIIAISGFNIAILSGMLLALGGLFLSRRGSAWFAFGGVALYTVLVGADAAVVRAAVMGGLFIFSARLLGRPTYAPAGLFTAAIFMSLHNPFILWDVGFQLSFAATLGLMLYVSPLSAWSEERIGRWTSPELARRITRSMSELIFATLAASLLTLPVIAFHFGQLSLISPVANLFVLPAQPGVMTWGGLSAVAGLISPAAGQLVAWIAWLFLSYTILMVRFFANLPGAAATVAISPAGVVAVYAFILGLTWLLRQRPEKRVELRSALQVDIRGGVALGLSILLAILGSIYLTSRPDGRLHVVFLDVGQGDATFIQTPTGRQFLIDGGPAPELLRSQLGRQMPFWDRDLDMVIATHPDDDHVAGLPDLFGRYEIGRLVTNGQEAREASHIALLEAATEAGSRHHVAAAGEVIEVGDGVRLEVIHPAAAGNQPLDDTHDNDLSLGLRLVYGDFSLLLTGDASQAAEREMIRSGRPLAAVVYQAGHHGSKSSSSGPFLAAVRPQIAVISVGGENRYGHPHPEVIDRLVDAGTAILRTDELGAVEVVTDGHQMWWEASKD